MLTRSPWVIAVLVWRVLLRKSGGFDTMPAFAGDMSGLKLMASGTSAVLTAWSIAGVVGPQLVAVLKNRPPERASNLSFAIGAGLLGLGFLLSLALSDRPAAKRN
jgi:OFA family oxalate/formate antiporter-like MFS transporter